MSGGVLDHKALIALNALEDGRLLYGPLSNVGPLLVLLLGARGVLLGGGGLPAGIPAVGELLKEVGLDGGRLRKVLVWWCLQVCQREEWGLTVKVGTSMGAVVVADSTADDASVASLRTA